MTQISLQQAFAVAAQHHQAGRLREAEAIYRQILAIQPGNPDVIHLMSVLAFQGGQTQTAVDLVDRAIAINPAAFDYHCNRGNYLSNLGRLDEAFASLQRAIQLDPNNPTGHNNLADVLCRQRRFAEAAAEAELALRRKPDYPDALNNLGIAFRNTDRLDDAITAYRRAVAIQPGFTKAWFNLAQALQAKNEPEPALAAYRQALLCDPKAPGVRHAMGLALRAAGRAAEAVEMLRGELALRPDAPEVCNDLGVALKESGDPEQAKSLFRRAIQLRPGFGDPYYNLGTILQDELDVEGAIEMHRQALRCRPDFAKAHNNLGTALHETGAIDEAIASLRKTAALQPEWAMAHHNLSLALLLKGEYEEGFAEHEWRSRLVEVDFYRQQFDRPQWTGQALSTESLLVHTEQGFGDSIQFIRYLPMAAQRCPRIILQCQPELLRLFEGMAGVGQIVARGEPLPAFDLHCPLLSLPALFQTRIDSIPGDMPYLRADAGRASRWRDRMPGDRFRLGLVWAGRPTHKNDRRRSIPASLLEAVADVPGVALFSLQKQLEGAPANIPAVLHQKLVDWTAELRDFADTAAIVENLDLVITVDTAVAHLAGAVGKPVWVLLPYVADWRWGMSGEKTAWYPTARLFRQPKRGDWSTVISQVVQALDALVRRT